MFTRAARADLYGDVANDALVIRPTGALVGGLATFDTAVVDGAAMGGPVAVTAFSSSARMLQNGYVRSYALSILAGAAIVLAAILVVSW